MGRATPALKHTRRGRPRACATLPGIDPATLINGDCLVELRKLPENSMDTCITDPPYELGFMGKTWDGTGIAFDPETWKAVYRVLKPGAFLLCFGGTRTFHRIAVAIEDAGFELRDCMMWLYGSGFPKSLDISKAIDKRRDDSGAKQAVADFLRPHVDRYGRKRIAALFSVDEAMVRQHWCSRSQTSTPTWEQWLRLREVLRFSDEMDAEVWRLNGRKGKPGEAWDDREVVGQQTKARSEAGKSALPTCGAGTVYVTWDVTAPATEQAKLWDGWGTALKPAWEPIIVAMKPTDGTFAQNALQWGVAGMHIAGGRIGSGAAGRFPANLILDEEAAKRLDAQAEGVARFFYCAKAGKNERGAGNAHPTVKPLKLMEYLCTLTKTPTGGSVLDPFLGSGTTILAALNTGRTAIGIEKEAEYFAIAKRRVESLPPRLIAG